jgi:hypothetical protein
MKRLAPIVVLLVAACGEGTPSAGSSAPAADPERGSAGQATSATPPAGSVAASTPAAETANTPGSSRLAEGGRTRRLEEFDMEALVWAMYHWAGVTPPLREWVEPKWRQEAYRRDEVVDEFFDREAFLSKLVEELEVPYRAARDIGYVRARVGGKLGPYDTQFEELYIEPFAPGSALRAYSEKTGRETSIRLSNALDAYAWPLPPDEAQAVLASLGSDVGRGSRDILVEVELRLTGARVEPSSGNGHVDAEILRYELYEDRSGRKGRLLHEADVSSE